MSDSGNPVKQASPNKRYDPAFSGNPGQFSGRHVLVVTDFAVRSATGPFHQANRRWGQSLTLAKCQKEMRIVSLIDGPAVIERIRRHLGLWEQGVRVLPARAPPEVADRVIEPCFDDPFPDYDTEPVMMYSERLSHRDRCGASPDTAVCVSSGRFAVTRLFHPRLDYVHSALLPGVDTSGSVRYLSRHESDPSDRFQRAGDHAA